ncbi:hypothetical protein BDK51DRAFT_25448 [Blyttiomyces helicus]|uniref:Secreted protein n=1 Tax=Blyttiomyces helicus TaxID=388810 RepID=A0A4P9WDB6_9FUNG|nr:hypothetical protein BDK51DRAFT_25448 [Blyttiomyces helicus]|eukprot:RKO90689.1 hypothetical protein BDK51DRAFT_25448 [Blyttiomyces helicus]
MLALAAIALLGVSAAAIPVENGGPNPADVFVESISYGGTGCPQGTVSQNFNDDRTGWTLIFDEFVANAGPGQPIFADRQNCQLSINVHLPAGWQYSVSTVDYRGFIQLDPNVIASQQSTYFFQGVLDSVSAKSQWVGPQDGYNYAVQDSFTTTSTVLSPCGGSAVVGIDTQIFVDNSRNHQGQGQMTTDSIDSKVTQIYSFNWFQC